MRQFLNTKTIPMKGLRPRYGICNDSGTATARTGRPQHHSLRSFCDPLNPIKTKPFAFEGSGSWRLRRGIAAFQLIVLARSGLTQAAFACSRCRVLVELKLRKPEGINWSDQNLTVPGMLFQKGPTVLAM